MTTRLAQAQVELEYETLYLPAKAWAEVAQVLVEFGEDLHNDIGLWRSFEQLNQRLFELPLPLTLPPGQTPTLPDQIAHLLWGLYSELNPDLILAPNHRDLRHLAYYQITAVERNGLTATNLLTDQPYSVRMETPGESFAVGNVVLGSLVPWHKEWYWSGEQRRFNALTESQLAEVLDSFARSAAQAIYRYDQARLAQAKETLARLHRHFLDHFGDELVVFPDGLTMAAAMQKFQRQYNEALLAEQPEIDSDRFDSDSAQPQMPYPPEIIDNENGVAVFFNPKEGTEMMVHFNDVIRALQKNGVGLDEDDNEALRGLLESPALSPQFVRRLVEAHGQASIAATYLIREPESQPVLDYLLRRTKGHFCRTRYPARIRWFDLR